MGLEPHKLKNSTTDGLVIKVMTVALTVSLWLASYLRSKGSTTKQFLKDLTVAHSCILSLALLTPFTLSPSTQLFYGCRVIQSPLMGQYGLLHPSGNSNLRAPLEERSFIDYFCVFRGPTCSLFFRLFVMIKLFTIGFPTFRISNPNSILGQPYFLRWIGNIPATENSCKCNRTYSFWPKSPYASGTDLTIFGCPSSRCTLANPTFGL